MSITKSQISALSALILLLLGILLTGCGNTGGGTGDTVPTPPRAMVDQSFRPPATVARPEASKPKH